jgi:Ala-tRNA(Pro) deacylase
MRILSEPELLAWLDQTGILYQRTEHPPVYTCEQADQYRPIMDGVSTKNLFLRGRREQRYHLVMTACEKRPDMKALGKQIGESKLHFGSKEMLMDLLGVEPGAVTVLGLINDSEHHIDLWIDAEIWDQSHFLCHPLVNTATLALTKAALERFFSLTGHVSNIIPIEQRDLGNSRLNSTGAISQADS